MDAKGKLQSYELVEFSITLTAPVTDWRAMSRQIKDLSSKATGSPWLCWPLSNLDASIERMLSDLDKTHEASITEKDCA